MPKLRFLFLCGILSSQLFAAESSEIQHLMKLIETMECQYERNGTLHTGQEAVEHIQKKYNYYKDDIKTTEDFIEYSATKSKMSGKYYMIQCPGKPVVKSKDWLLQALKEFRSK